MYPDQGSNLQYFVARMMLQVTEPPGQSKHILFASYITFAYYRVQLTSAYFLSLISFGGIQYLLTW